MSVEFYHQVGSWYWQADGLEIYSKKFSMNNSFIHSNDDIFENLSFSCYYYKYCCMEKRKWSCRTMGMGTKKYNEILLLIILILFIIEYGGRILNIILVLINSATFYC